MGAGHHHGQGLGASAWDTGTGAAFRDRLTLVFGITVAVFAVEVVAGLLSGSLALLADAGHMLTDVAGIGLTLLALRFSRRPATLERTFGYYRLEIFAAVINAVLLFGVAGAVLVEAVRRFTAPPEVAGGIMLGAAALGLAANTAGLLLLRPGLENLNIRGAYLEVLADLFGSAAVLVAAVVIWFTGWTLADPAASTLIGLAILPRTWSLLREAVDVLLEATPKGVDLSEVRAHLEEIPGVLDVHDLHAWAITPGLPVLSAHVVVDGATLTEGRYGELLDRMHACLAGHFDVEHSTFQIEPVGHAEHEGARHA